MKTRGRATQLIREEERAPDGYGGGGDGQRRVQDGQPEEAHLLVEDALREDVADVHRDHHDEDDGHRELDAARGLEQNHRQRERHARHARHLRRRPEQRVLPGVHALQRHSTRHNYEATSRHWPVSIVNTQTDRQ